jgi:hypothetical protein
MKIDDHSVARVARWASLLPIVIFILLIAYIQLTFALQEFDIFLPQPHRLGFEIILYSSGVLCLAALLLSGVTFFKGKLPRFRTALPACLGVILLGIISHVAFPLLDVVFPARMQIGSWLDPSADLTQALRRNDRRLIILVNHLGQEMPGVSRGEMEANFRNLGLKVIADKEWIYPEGIDDMEFYGRARAYAEKYNIGLLAEMKRQTTR